MITSRCTIATPPCIDLITCDHFHQLQKHYRIIFSGSAVIELFFKVLILFYFLII